jgi:hypothetical protein
VHGPGDVQGEPIALDDEMALHLCWAYRSTRRPAAASIRRDILSARRAARSRSSPG